MPTAVGAARWYKRGFLFFRLAKKNGYNLHCYTDVKLSHLGGLKVKSDGTVTIADM